MLIRPETEQDFAILHDLVKTAFETAPVKDGKEQDYVRAFRTSNGYVSELALVAEDGVLIGHIMLTRIVLTETKKPLKALLLAPVCVAPEHQNQGTGSALIRKSMERAKEMSFDAIFVVGDPAYYERFGFRQTASYGIVHQPVIPAEYVIVCELIPGSLTGVAGLKNLSLYEEGDICFRKVMRFTELMMIYLEKY